MTTTVQIRAAGATVIFGLDWKSLLATDDFDPLLEARSVADDTGYKFCVVHQRKRTGVGYMPVKELLPRGTNYSASVLAALGTQQPAVYIAALHDGRYWICYVQADQVLSPKRPDTAARSEVATPIDNIASAQVTTQHYNELMTGLRTRGDRATRVILIGVVGLDIADTAGTEKITIEQFVKAAGVATTAVLKPIYPSPYRFLPYAAAIAIALLVAWGYREYTALQELAREAEAKSIPADVLRLKESRMTEAVAQMIRLDTATPSPAELVRYCSRYAAQIGAKFHGWRVTAVKCDPITNRLTAELSADFRSSSTPNPSGLNRAVMGDGGNVQFSADLQAATLNFPMPVAAVREAMDRNALPKHSDHIATMSGPISVARRADKRFMVNLTPLTPRQIFYRDPSSRDPTTNIEPEQQVPEGQAYFTATIDITAPGYPNRLPIAIDQKHFRVDRIEITPQTDTVMSHVVLTAHFQPG